jgi:hypothetical protein
VVLNNSDIIEDLEVRPTLTFLVNEWKHVQSAKNGYLSVLGTSHNEKKLRNLELVRTIIFLRLYLIDFRHS